MVRNGYAMSNLMVRNGYNWLESWLKLVRKLVKNG